MMSHAPRTYLFDHVASMQHLTWRSAAVAALFHGAFRDLESGRPAGRDTSDPLGIVYAFRNWAR